MNLLRSTFVAVALATLAACASLPARPAGGMVADLTEDVPLVSQDGLSRDFATEAQRIDVQQRAWEVIAERYYDPRLNGVDWPAIRDKYRPRVAGAKTDAQFYLALKSMARELNDSHTRVVTPRESADRRRFELLKRAYVEARYSHAYEITPDELAWLVERVRHFHTIAAAICAEHLENDNGRES